MRKQFGSFEISILSHEDEQKRGLAMELSQKEVSSWFLKAQPE